MTVTGPQLSDASAAPSGTLEAVQIPGSQPTSTGGGQPMVGGELSNTSIICTHEVLSPQPSVAVQVRVITLMIGHDPPDVESE